MCEDNVWDEKYIYIYILWFNIPNARRFLSNVAIYTEYLIITPHVYARKSPYVRVLFIACTR